MLVPKASKPFTRDAAVMVAGVEELHDPADATSFTTMLVGETPVSEFATRLRTDMFIPWLGVSVQEQHCAISSVGASNVYTLTQMSPPQEFLGDVRQTRRVGRIVNAELQRKRAVGRLGPARTAS